MIPSKHGPDLDPGEILSKFIEFVRYAEEKEWGEEELCYVAKIMLALYGKQYGL